MMRRKITHITGLLTVLILVWPVVADPGKPVAVRWWGQAFVTIETYWNLTIAIDPYATSIGYDDPKITADVVLVTHNHRDHSNVSLLGKGATAVIGLDNKSNVASIDMVLDRLPNQDKPTLTAFSPSAEYSIHAVRFRSITSFHDDQSGSRRGNNAMFLIQADGVRILHCGDLGQTKLTEDQLGLIGQVDVLLIPVGGVYTVDGKQAAAIVAQISPRYVVPIHYKTPQLTIPLNTDEEFLKALSSKYERKTPVGNTLAVAHNLAGSDESLQVVTLHTRPWKMPNELAELFKRKDAANRKSQEVFAKLSTKQMNHRPSNGTHTPRWNAEHMMGRELGFFSKIYNSVDPAIPSINLNPKQMPADYVAAHPDWDGKEEARQMQRVISFTRRFAYLFDGITLETKPPGSWWTVRGLLEQMQRHYGEHTSNVKDKFELPDWPGE
ncbi:MAG: MBL fold metallo-hydrolase [Planctomycetes bacterium]|nr:MBL fold metallo-hydrolase [Planctomycetota bacterium]